MESRDPAAEGNDGDAYVASRGLSAAMSDSSAVGGVTKTPLVVLGVELLDSLHVSDLPGVDDSELGVAGCGVGQELVRREPVAWAAVFFRAALSGRARWGMARAISSRS